MVLTFQVKTRFLALLALSCSSLLEAAEAPDAREILKSVRVAQAAQAQSLKGRLRSGGKAIPFQLSVSGDTIRWDFTDPPPQSLLLRLREKDSRLEEIGKGGSAKVSAARFDDKVRDSDISYEDLAMRFLYWSNATVEGEQTMLLTKCWIIRALPPNRADSQYSAVKLWIAKNTGALMQAEAFGGDGKLVRRFKVISGQSLGEGVWILKEMRIEEMTPGKSADRTPSYLSIEKPAR
ncbi:MAG TPA: outer membrane lipoprotein-sorting protein [Chthoniobacteraceae bacterium]|jgi:hypothetical protein